jgi:ABC-type transport system substrate-binding protein
VKKDQPQIGIYEDGLTYASPFVVAFGWLPDGKPPFLDKRVRQAISMGLNRDLFNETFYNVSNFSANGIDVSPRWNSHAYAQWDGWWLDPQSSSFGPNAKYFQHNIAEAKLLLKAAGYPDGFEVKSNYVTSGPLSYLARIYEAADNMYSDIGVKVTIHPLDYITEYIPMYRDGQGQYEGWAYPSLGGTGAETLSPLRQLATEYWPGGGISFKGFSASGKNDKSGDPELNRLFEKARREYDTEARRTLVHDIQRYLAETQWSPPPLGGPAKGFSVAWPVIGNYRAWNATQAVGLWTNYRWWIDETKAPLK